MSVDFCQEVDLLIRARYPVLYVVTWEEGRARQLLTQVAQRQEKAVYEWSITDGLRVVCDPKRRATEPSNRCREVMAVLNEVLQSSVPAIYVLKDFHAFIKSPEVVRQLRDLHDSLRSSYKTVVIMGPVVEIPTELEKAVTLVDLPLPSYDELVGLLRSICAGRDSVRKFAVDLNPEQMDALAKAAQGLTMTEAENVFAKTIVRDSRLDATDIQDIIGEKKQIIRKSGLLEYCDTLGGINQVGGMDLLKDWLRKRVRAFGQEARHYGLPSPRGVLLLGVQGCGKSLLAKTIAHEWRYPLLRMDMSRIFQAYIGSSEENMRRALRMAEMLAPVVLWVDEIEKAFAGLEGSSASDAGTTARIIGQFLTWMQEKQTPVFVVATANSVKNLPPELLRKGRLDEIFFVDLPRSRERAEILQIHLNKLKRDPARFDLSALVKSSHGFSGAEIEQGIISAMHDSFFENREVESRDIVTALGQTVPLSRTMSESISALRAWASERARPVSSVQCRAESGAG